MSGAALLAAGHQVHGREHFLDRHSAMSSAAPSLTMICDGTWREIVIECALSQLAPHLPCTVCN